MGQDSSLCVPQLSMTTSVNLWPHSTVNNEVASTFFVPVRHRCVLRIKILHCYFPLLNINYIPSIQLAIKKKEIGRVKLWPTRFTCSKDARVAKHHQHRVVRFSIELHRTSTQEAEACVAIGHSRDRNLDIPQRLQQSISTVVSQIWWTPWSVMTILFLF